MSEINPKPGSRQELANTLTHGLGVLFGLAGVPLLVLNALENGDPNAWIGALVFGLSFLLLYSSSTLYHLVEEGQRKHLLRKLDHISIYFLISGSYTPFVLIYVQNSTGYLVLGILWGLTIFGTLFKLFYTGKFDIISTLVYLMMGWMLLPVADVFFERIPQETITLIAAGGALYTLGVLFYLWERLTYNHAIWHLFVLSASICHFSAVYLAVG